MAGRMAWWRGEILQRPTSDNCPDHIERLRVALVHMANGIRGANRHGRPRGEIAVVARRLEDKIVAENRQAAFDESGVRVFREAD